jgi:hypothetical protein
MRNVFDYLSGEFILDYMPNGGIAVLFRTILVSVLIYFCAVILKMYSADQDVKKVVAETIPWLGAILGGTYAAFYSRFSSQWAYIADLYNQQMALAITLSDVTIEGDNYKAWQSAFIEDAVCMHLATKEGFRNAINEMLEDEDIRNLLCEHVGNKKVERLRTQLAKALRK